jgi:phenylalanyl-tRNA synthetase alpha chain
MDPVAIDRLLQEFADDLAGASSDREVQAVRDRYLGRRSGVVSSLLKAVAAAPPAERPRLGQLANDLKRDIEARLTARRDAILAAGRPIAPVDVTLPGRLSAVGRLHPLALIRERVETIFARMGFQILEGPEVEDDWHNFEALNMPPEHPARDMQDTLYLATPLGPPEAVPTGTIPDSGLRRSLPLTLLRTHTSAMQVRYMEQHEPPVRIVALGRVYRRDNLDLTHSPMFTQVEGLLVDAGITLAHLKGTVETLLHELFSPDTKVMLRPSFFPYTEPSGEFFIGCLFCGESGCAVCKRTGWLEIGGSGLVHPAVFEAVGYDPERVSGFAFGLGIERIAQLKYGVDDMRLFYENDLRFLEQFPE